MRDLMPVTSRSEPSTSAVRTSRVGRDRHDRDREAPRRRSGTGPPGSASRAIRSVTPSTTGASTRLSTRSPGRTWTCGPRPSASRSATDCSARTSPPAAMTSTAPRSVSAGASAAPCSRSPASGSRATTSRAGWVRRVSTTPAGSSGSPPRGARAVSRAWSTRRCRAGDTIEVVHRPGHGVTVSHMFRALTTDRQLLPDLLVVDGLVEEARQAAEKYVAAARR